MLPLDVTSDESVEAVVREVMRFDGRIDLLVNNAGFCIAPAGAEESSIEQARLENDSGELHRVIPKHFFAQSIQRFPATESVSM